MARSWIDTEITKTGRQITDVAGAPPRLFRSPGGAWSRNVLAAAAHQMLQAAPGDIILCHDGGGDRSETLQALRTVIPRLKSRGLQFITL